MAKSKELIICIISIIALILAITTNVFATNGTPDLNSLLGNAINAEQNLANNEGFEEIVNSYKDTNTNTNVNTNVNTNTTNTMPNTGVSYSSLVIIAVAGISAVYAYKKIKEYNV